MASTTPESKRCVPPPNPGARAAPRPVVPLRAARTRQHYLLWQLGRFLLLQWSLRVEPLATLQLIADVDRPAMSRKDRALFARVVAETVGDSDPEASPSPTMLEAATRWFCALDLPGKDSDSWASPSL